MIPETVLREEILQAATAAGKTEKYKLRYERKGYADGMSFYFYADRN